MRTIFGLLATFAGIYSLLIFIRIIFSWFRNFVSGKPVEILNKITDPYLNWWRRSLSLQIGFIDFSAVAAIVSLGMIQRIFQMLAIAERISIGSILAIILTSFWMVVSFIIGFCIIVIVLRAVGYMTNRNIYSPFWNAVDSISQPLVYRLNRLVYKNRIVSYINGIVVSLLILFVIMLGGKYLVHLLAGFLGGLPF